ncbi:DNA-binding PadR family transcriptional regulator [Cryobacterium sp. MP_M5]|uniref:PadR family transcriptional regulator n=1 Tax=unclassified Cryobacterium TaxID=2649013 RepID=UPI0018CAFD4E|nr:MULTISPECIES: PadR family transcriptional regulator [unclassified Cryobacterium]MBG6059338.1 DNA-binding PadR family transcriptional regulator [Cryobacterium sp. MP_M3]MEC5177814.1 DNA-binding PadR family transcriptional regulator [Cryobacterium sp. MP_M5]
MSVRTTLLAILTIGPAYGFQLHGELESRTAGRRAVNVGQIYGTLERLVKQGAVESGGATTDGLPLYRITAEGRAEAMEWLMSVESTRGEEWNDLVDRVLLASSLPHIDSLALIGRYREHWLAIAEPSGNRTSPVGQELLEAGARTALASAAVAWLDSAGRSLLDPRAATFQRGLSDVRPRRGRRPVPVA